MYKEYFDSVDKWFDNKIHEGATCPICGNKFLAGLEEYPVCTCGLTIQSPQPSQETLDDFYEESDSMEKWAQIKDSEKENKRQGNKFYNVWKYIADYGMEKVLDVGCGNGFFLNHLKLGNITKVGVEPSAAAREYCEFPTYKDLKEFDESLHAGLCYDMITFFGVLEHVKKPGELINKYKKYLAYDGKIAVIVPNVDSLLVDTLKEEAATFCPQHLWYYNIHTLNKLMLMTGMELDKWLTVEPETQPILKKLRGFDPYAKIGIQLTDPDINDTSIILNNKGYKVVAFFKRSNHV